MYFKPQLIQKIIDLKKTQTRRICKPGEMVISTQGSPGDPDSPYFAELGGPIQVVLSDKGRSRFEINKDYAVCPGRGKPMVWYAALRTVEGRIAEIITDESSQLHQSIALPCRIFIKGIRLEKACEISDQDARAEGFQCRDEFLAAWDEINGKGKQDAKVWVLDFELVRN